MLYTPMSSTTASDQEMGRHLQYNNQQYSSQQEELLLGHSMVKISLLFNTHIASV
jgi:hypothetical protein